MTTTTVTYRLEVSGRYDLDDEKWTAIQMWHKAVLDSGAKRWVTAPDVDTWRTPRGLEIEVSGEVDYGDPLSTPSPYNATSFVPCPTCSGPSRETVGLVCQACGTDYGDAP